jgi:tRNA G18 (ribose-2'-O)-methylase SpoU
VCIALGGEHAGLSGPLAQQCHELVRIPMLGRATSLNVSVACAILLYERLRQNQGAGAR